MKELLKETKMICEKLPAAKPGRWQDFWMKRARALAEELQAEAAQAEEAADLLRGAMSSRQDIRREARRASRLFHGLYELEDALRGTRK